ncbi:MAG: hypothetical protein ACFE94_02905 [Candidatus Hodarchaeota archaeon]
MKSKNSVDSEEKYKKATELLQKLWWFCFYLVISPFAIGFVGFLIFRVFGLSEYFALSLSVITFMFAFLFFLKSYDKYRIKSFFLNKENNLVARIHITFSISIISFIVTPIFILIAPDVSFDLLPLISFALLYNIVYYYYRFKPIAFFNIAEREYKHGTDFKLTLKQPYNFIVSINYIAHLCFLSITSRTKLSWIFALATNLVLYVITILSTKKICNGIKESINNNRSFLIELTEFKRKFVISITSLVFILLIQIPLMIVIIFRLLGTPKSLDILNSSFLSVIFLFLYLKALFYTNYYHSNRIEVYKASIKGDSYKDKVPARSVKYQKYNAYLSVILVVLIATFAFLIQITWLILLILPFFFIFSYSEQKAGICPKNYNKFIFLLNSIAILISVAFGLFSEISLNYQFLIFVLSLYFTLQIFVKTDYFSKENVIVIQNLLATASSTIIAYSIVYEFALFSSDPTFNVMIHGLLISIISLITFYIFYSWYFSQQRLKLFRSCLFVNIILIELFIFLLINLSTSFLMEVLIISSLLFPSVLLFFIFVNYTLGVFSREDFVKISYYLLWVLIFDVFLSILLTNLTKYVIWTLDFLFLSVFGQVNLKFGSKIETVKESVVKKFAKLNSYFMTIELIALFFFFFYSVALVQFFLHDKIILSTYFSFFIMTILANVLSRLDVVFSSSITLKINILALFFSTGLAFYYTFIFTLGTFNVCSFPFISLFITLYFPFYFLLRKRIYETFIRKGLLINSALLAIFITLIPIFINLEFSRTGPINILSVINYTLLIFPSMFLFIGFTDYLLKLLSQKQFLILSFYLLWVLITDLFVIIFLVSLTEFVFLVLDFLFLSTFSQLNLMFGVKLEKVKDSKGKFYSNINSYIITGEIFALSFFFFYTIVLVEIIFSVYISLLIITFLVNLISRKELIFSKSLTFKINIITLTFSAGLAYYYSFLLTFNTFYVLLIPSLCLFSILFLPIYYTLRMKIYEKVAYRLLLVDCILIGIFLMLIPTFINLEVNGLGFFNEKNLLPTINNTLYIAFGILAFTYYLLRKYKIKEIYISRVLQSQIFIEIIIAGTTVFYYLFRLIPGTFFSILFPLIAASCFLYLPSIFSYRKRYFKENIVKKFILANSIVLSVLITLIPTIIGLELKQIGISIISATSLIILFLVLNFLELIGRWYKVKEKWTSFFKLFKVFVWFSISIFVSYLIFSYVPIDLSISIIFFTFFILNIYTLRLLFNYSSELRIVNYLKEFLLYGLTFSFSFLIITLIRLSIVLTLMPSLLYSFNILWYLGFFLLISLLLIQFFKSKVQIKYLKINNGIEFVSWSILKIVFCIFISLIFSYSINAQVISFSLAFTFFTPITLYYFKKLNMFSEKNQLIIKRFMLGIFLISLFILYIDLFYQLTTNVIFFNDYVFLYVSFILANLILYLYYFLLRYNTILQIDSTLQIFGFYFSSFILFFSLLYIYWIILIIPVFLAIILLLYRRSLNLIFRFISYFLLSYVIFIDLLSIFNNFEILGGFNLFLFGFLTSTYLLTLISILLFSIWLNFKRNNNLEKFVLYSLLSLLSFTLLNSYTNVLILYNITISLFIFLLFMGIYFYRQENEYYKWFIKPCILLLIFDFISFISYFILFNNPIYISFNPILTFTLTTSITGFTFVLLYNKAPARFRKISFYFTLFAINICFPTFLYFCIVSPFPSLFGDPIPTIIVINVAVFLFYLCIGIYQWRISWAIWKSGWYVWNILPFVNFLIIYQGLRGVDVLGNSIQLFGVYDFSGSSIISIIICSLFFLPVIYSKIKKYFLNIVFIVWAESLFLMYWISQNLFAGDKLLTNLSFVLFSVILLMPLLVGLKFWKIASIFWIIPLTVINATFLFFYFISIGVSLEITISIDILVIGLFLIVYSFFPNIRSIGIILILSYFVVLLGIFLTIYFILYSVILDIFFSINVSFIVMGFGLFSSKPLKLENKSINYILSWILIVNFSWLTFNTFNLIPRMGIFAFFLSLTVFGGSFFIFNRYRMKFRINRAFPFLIVAIGTSSSITSLFWTFFNLSPYLLITVFSGIFLIFLYSLIIEYRYFLWALIPIPLTLPLLELLISIELIRNVWLLAFSAFSTIYIIFFQILINVFKTITIDESEEIKNSLLKIYEEKNQIKMLNFTSFLLNSVFISIFISIIIPFLTTQLLFSEIIIIYQILDFLVIWPIFILVSLKYIEIAEIDLNIRDPLLYFNKICYVLYLLIPIALYLNVLLFMFFIEMSTVIMIYGFLLIVSGVVFFESSVLDRSIFYFLFHSTRNKFIFWSWLVFSNTLCFFFFMFYSNIFLLLVLISLLNQISLSFGEGIDISKQKISNGRIILFYTLFISGSFYLGFLITEGIVNLLEELRGFTYYLLLFQNSVLPLYILSNFVKIETKLKYSIEIILFTIFQCLLAINWLIIFNIFSILNFFSIILIILIETCLSFKTVKFFNVLFFETKKPQFLLKTFSLLIILLYFETSLLIFGLMIEFVDVFKSILISQLLFFSLTLLDIYSLKKIRKSYAFLIHTISFFIISLMIIFILNNLVAQYQILLSIEVLIFILMQFYTNYSFCNSLNQFYPSKVESIKKRRSNINHVLGTIFYVDLCLILLHTLILSNVEFLLILLILSLIVHVLMIIDLTLLKFLGRFANYFKVISWIFIIVFTTTYFLWLYVIYFIEYLFSSIPLIVFILIIESAYLFKQLEFLDYIVSNKKRIKFYLISITYLNFTSWPIYYVTLNPFQVLNLMILSLVILFFFTFVDKYVGILKEKPLKTLRKASFSLIGLFLSIDIFILLRMVPTTTLTLDLSVSLLIFVVFSVFIVKPFKEHSLKAFAFWAAICSLLSLILSELSHFWQGLFIFIPLMIIPYPFVFLLEELREFFNKLVDIIVKFFQKIKLLLSNAFKALFKFLKTYFKILWILLSLSLAVFFGIISLQIFDWVHSILLMIVIFGILYLIIPSPKSDDPDVKFKIRIKRLSIGWGSVISFLFMFITNPNWYMPTILITISVVGSMILVYLRKKEEREKIAVKWRFYTLLTLFVLLIIFTILVIAQQIVISG